MRRACWRRQAEARRTFGRALRHALDQSKDQRESVVRRGAGLIRQPPAVPEAADGCVAERLLAVSEHHDRVFCQAKINAVARTWAVDGI
jgi:hypothetical protein